MARTARRPSTKTFSIFGQIEEVAAEIMLADGRARLRIEPDAIPESALYNDQGTRARFAVMIPTEHVYAFNKLIKDLYA